MNRPAVMSGSGNTFFVMDNLSRHVKDLSGRTRSLCERLGVDGGIFVEPSDTADVAMRIINADGSEAEMCGNGARCMARYAYDRGIVGRKTFSFSTPAGIIGAEIRPEGSVKVRLTDPADIRMDVPLATEHFSGTVHCINTGVPHAVIPVDDADAVDVLLLGREIRHAAEFRPSGTNVNFITIGPGSTLKVRTYERGVENETGACGTGATASACCARLLGRVSSPARVTTSSGEELTVYFEFAKDTFTNVFLEGKVEYREDDNDAFETD